MACRITPEKAREYNDRAYAKRFGITVEQLEDRRKAAQKKKEQKKNRPVKQIRTPRVKRLKLKPLIQQKRDAWWEALKKKHAGKSRLEKSLQPPLLLNLPRDERL